MATGNGTQFGCLTLAPFRECLFGECVNGTCVCQEGWSQSFEFLYQDVDRSVVSYCDYSAALQVSLSAVILVLVVVTTVLQSLLVSNRSQFRRLVPFYVGHIMLLYTVCVRLARPYDSLYGSDVFYSWVYMLFAGFLLVQTVIFFNKYLVYVLKLFEFKRRTKWLSIRFKVFSYSIAVLLLAAFIAWPLEIVIESQEEKQTLQRVASGYISFFHLVMFLAGTYLLTKYIIDLNSIIEDRGISPVEASLAKRCKAAIRRTRRLRLLAGLGNGFAFIMNLLCAIYEGWAKLYSLMLFLAVVLMELGFLSALRATGRDKLLKRFADIKDGSKRVLGSGLTITATMRRSKTSTRKGTNPKESITNSNNL